MRDSVHSNATVCDLDGYVDCVLFCECTSSLKLTSNYVKLYKLTTLLVFLP